MYELKGKMVNEDGILWGYLIAKNGRGRYVPKDLALKNLHLIDGAYNRRGYVALKHKKMGMVGEYRLSHSLDSQIPTKNSKNINEFSMVYMVEIAKNRGRDLIFKK